MPKVIDHAPILGAIKPRYLHDVVKDTRSRLYGGLCVIASIAGATVSQAADAIRPGDLLLPLDSSAPARDTARHPSLPCSHP